MEKKNPNSLKQMTLMSSLGIFYLMVIAIFGIPLLGAFVALFIKGVLDMKYAIIIGGVALLSFAVYYLVKLCIYLFRKIKKDGLSANQELREYAGRGEPVQISLLNGLLTFSYQGGQPILTLPCSPQQTNSIPLITDTANEKDTHTATDVITKLKELSDLKHDGIITEDEFYSLKARLLKDVDLSDNSMPLTEKDAP